MSVVTSYGILCMANVLLNLNSYISDGEPEYGALR